MLQFNIRGGRLAAILVQAWDSLNLKHVAATAALCFAWSCCESARHAADLISDGNYAPVINAVLSMQFNGLAVLLGVNIVNQTTFVVRGAWWPYLPAVACSVLLGTSATWIVSQHVLNLTTAYEPQGVAEPYRTFAFRHAAHALLICGLGTLAYLVRRQATARLATLHNAQLGRANAERDLQLSRLAAMHARVDPQVITQALARIEQSYECDRALGDRELQSLVDELRTAVKKNPDRYRSIDDSCAPLASAAS